jgi:hypothetical protein
MGQEGRASFVSDLCPTNTKRRSRTDWAVYGKGRDGKGREGMAFFVVRCKQNNKNHLISALKKKGDLDRYQIKINQLSDVWRGWRGKKAGGIELNLSESSANKQQNISSQRAKKKDQLQVGRSQIKKEFEHG